MFLFNAQDQEYIVRSEDNTIAIVDAFSGRVLEGRRFTDGLQQSIEAKEGVPVSGETQVREGCAASDPCFATLGSPASRCGENGPHGEHHP